jgi:hypothetical protein
MHASIVPEKDMEDYAGFGESRKAQSRWILKMGFRVHPTLSHYSGKFPKPELVSKGTHFETVKVYIGTSSVKKPTLFRVSIRPEPVKNLLEEYASIRAKELAGAGPKVLKAVIVQKESEGLLGVLFQSHERDPVSPVRSPVKVVQRKPINMIVPRRVSPRVSPNRRVSPRVSPIRRVSPRVSPIRRVSPRVSPIRRVSPPRVNSPKRSPVRNSPRTNAKAQEIVESGPLLSHLSKFETNTLKYWCFRFNLDFSKLHTEGNNQNIWYTLRERGKYTGSYHAVRNDGTPVILRINSHSTPLRFLRMHDERLRRLGEVGLAHKVLRSLIAKDSSDEPHGFIGFVMEYDHDTNKNRVDDDFMGKGLTVKAPQRKSPLVARKVPKVRNNRPHKRASKNRNSRTPKRTRPVTPRAPEPKSSGPKSAFDALKMLGLVK